MNFKIRPARIEDAESIGKLIKEFTVYMRSIGDQGELKFGAGVFARDGFGENPAFSGIVAESEDGKILGYLLYHFGYDTDYATRTLHIVDLYVQENQRGQGIGKSLMNRASEICRFHNGTQLFWSVYVPNKAAIEFYERLGARFTQDLLFMRLDL